MNSTEKENCYTNPTNVPKIFWTFKEDQKMIRTIRNLEDYNWGFISFVMKKSIEECMSRWENELCFCVPDRPYDKRDNRMMVELFYLLDTDWETISFVTFRNVYSLQKHYLKITKIPNFYDYIILKKPLVLAIINEATLQLINDFRCLSYEEKIAVKGLVKYGLSTYH